MSDQDQLRALISESWDRAQAHMYVMLGREPLAWEVAFHIMQSQLYALAMFVLPDSTARIEWLKASLDVITEGRGTGVVS